MLASGVVAALLLADGVEVVGFLLAVTSDLAGILACTVTALLCFAAACCLLVEMVVGSFVMADTVTGLLPFCKIFNLMFLLFFTKCGYFLSTSLMIFA